MRLFRSHGLGNDYLVLTDGTALSPSLVRAICDRHVGVGSDGILEPVDARDGAAYGLRIHNPDGSEAEKSGNGIRIFAHWLVRARGAPAEFDVWTPGGVVRCAVEGDDVRVQMGRARVLPVVTSCGMRATPVDLGNPHHVVLDVPANWRELGARIEQAVPGRTNVQFVEVRGARDLGVKVWERGAGETRSSGSSACAAAAVCVAAGLVASPVRVRMEGGDLRVTVTRDGDVELQGPVEAIAEIDVGAEWLRRRSS